MSRWVIAAFAAVVVIALAAAAVFAWSSRPAPWTEAELAAIRSLALASLEPLPPDPSNRVAEDPQAIALGKQLFFDPRLSANGGVACATCHVPGLYFTDGRTLAQGLGVINRHSMSLLGAAYSAWYTWDGKADSLWAQALLPLESTAEQGSSRMDLARVAAQHYAEAYAALFGPLPDLSDTRRFPAHATPAGSAEQAAAWNAMLGEDQQQVNRVVSNLTKAIAAYERTLLPQPARFDRYVEALNNPGAAPAGSSLSSSPGSSLSNDELAGLRLFIGKAQCINCHNGPLFTNFEFHNTAVPPTVGFPLDHGRSAGIAALGKSEFTCLGPYSDAAEEECGEIRFLKSEGDTLDGSFRTPTLRNVEKTAPYMHAGQFATLEEVVQHYNQGGYALLGHNELTPLNLSDQEVNQLVAFLKTLTGPPPEVD